MQNHDPLSATFHALADPTRRAILSRLASGETSVTELAAPFAMSLPAISKHLKVLEHAGLITRGREAQWRPCKLEAKPMQAVAGWLEQYRQFWEERLDRLEAYLRELQAAETSKKKSRKDAMTIPQDVEEYLAAVPPEMRAALEKLRRTIRAAAPDAEEVISYRIPTFKLGKGLVAYGAARRHCALYPMSTAVMEAFRDELEPYDTSKGTIRFTPDKPLPAALIKKLVKARIAENAALMKK